MLNVPLDSKMLRTRAMQCRHLADGMQDSQMKERLHVLQLTMKKWLAARKHRESFMDEG